MTEFQRPLRMALIGGGGAGFIGRVHVTAATLDREAELVAGAFSSDPDRSRQSAEGFGLAPDRAFGSWSELLQAQSDSSADSAVDFVSIATPNHTHCEIACAALKAGLHVFCDKPMTVDTESAARLSQAVRDSGRVFVLTHNYSGYPMVRQAREMIAAGDLGRILGVRVQYVQGWMHGMDPAAVPERGAWKSDPQKNGRAGSLGDVGTHAFHLARYMSGVRPVNLSARMKSWSAHHELDDYGQALVGCEGDATLSVTWSQVSHGRLNDLSIEIDGTKGSLAWRQEDPNYLVLRRHGQATQILDRVPQADWMTRGADAACRLPGGHPEAFFEAFANVYRGGFEAIRSSDAGLPLPTEPIYPTVEDGCEGVQFMTRCLESNDADSSWQNW